MGELASEVFIQYAPVAGVAFQEHVAGHCHRAGFKPQVLFEAHDTFAILTMVAAGLGIAILPDWVMRAPHPGIDFRRLTQVPPLVDLALAWVAEKPAAHVQAFIELAESYSRRVP